MLILGNKDRISLGPLTLQWSNETHVQIIRWLAHHRPTPTPTFFTSQTVLHHEIKKHYNKSILKQLTSSL